MYNSFLHFKKVFYKYIILLSIFIFIGGCQLQEQCQNHGILFLKNRSAKLKVNSQIKTMFLKMLKYHSKSINDDNEWIFIERTLLKVNFIISRNICKRE